MSWPLPRKDEDRMVVLMELLDWVPDSPYMIMIRKKGMNYVGVIDEINLPKFDSQYGKKIGQLSGFKPNGGRKFDVIEFMEPRYQKVPNTGELKEGIIHYNNMFVLVARNTEDFSDDFSNFTYEVPENEMAQFGRLSQHVDEQKVTIMDIEEKAKEYRFRAERLQTQSDTLGRELNKLRARDSEIMQYNLDLEAQVKKLLKENKALRISNETEEARMDMKQANATEIGQMQGMTSTQLVETAVDSFQNTIMKLENLQGNDVSQVGYNEVKKEIGDKFKKLEDEIKKIATGKKTSVTKNDEEG